MQPPPPPPPPLLRYFDLTFQLNERSIQVMEHDLNRILGFPIDNFSPEPTVDEVMNFLLILSYQGELDQMRLYKNHFPKEWNFILYTLSHTFTTKTSCFHGITRSIQMLGCTVANKILINVGKWLMKQIIQTLTPKVQRDFDNSHFVCLYPRFLQLVFDGMLTEHKKLSFSESAISVPSELQSNSMTYLIYKADYTNALPSILTGFMTDCMCDMARPTLPPQGLSPNTAATPEAAEPTEDVYIPHALDEDLHFNIFDEFQGSPSGNDDTGNFIFNIDDFLVEGDHNVLPSEALGHDHGPENQEGLTQILETNR